MPKCDILKKILLASKGGIDKLTTGLNFQSADKGNCSATFVVQQAHTNFLGSLHGGFAATLIDNISNLGLVTHAFGDKPSVSVNLSVNFYKPSYVGDELLFDARTVKVGKSVAFLEVEVFNNTSKEIVMKGTHVKHLVQAENAVKIYNAVREIEELHKRPSTVTQKPPLSENQ